MPRTLRPIPIVLGVLGALLVVGLGVVYFGARTSAVRERIEAALSERLDSEVELGAISVSVFPSLSITGENVRIRHRGRTDVPPLIQVRRFTADGGLIGLFSRVRHLRTVRLEGLQIHIPPRDSSGERFPDSPGGDRTAREGTDRPDDDSGRPRLPSIEVDTVEAVDAQLILVPRRKDKDPKVFLIHNLILQSVGRSQAMPFKATLTNPIPQGDIVSSGRIGPWDSSEPAQTPVAGDYSFKNVKMHTIKGISGMLESEGKFKGPLDRIEVDGWTKIPDFKVEVGGAPVPLSTTFHAIVDGTNGETYLQPVNATFLNTAIVATGGVTKEPGVKGRTVALDVKIEKGRIEDLLRLAVKAEKPLMVGDVQLTTKFLLPPGEPDVPERLELDGRFGVSDAEFTGNTVRQKLGEMSRRAQGKSKEEGAGDVVTNLSGTFRLRDGVIRFSNLSFEIPGALVRISGSYGLESEAIDFSGTLRMEATVSEAAGGGWKSALLKMVDPLFRKRGAGAILPIRITGTRENPKFGLDVGKVFSPK